VLELRGGMFFAGQGSDSSEMEMEGIEDIKERFG
jgi:hypothetical protein